MDLEICGAEWKSPRRNLDYDQKFYPPFGQYVERKGFLEGLGVRYKKDTFRRIVYNNE